jgi:hypothetical protein
LPGCNIDRALGRHELAHRRQPNPKPSGSSTLDGIATISANNIWAVGSIGVSQTISNPAALGCREAKYCRGFRSLSRPHSGAPAFVPYRPRLKHSGLFVGPQDAGQPGRYNLEGRFNLHGAERKVHFKAKVERGEKDAELPMTAAFTINQTDYGIKPVTAAGGLVKVADELEIQGDLVLRPASE